MKRQTLDSMRDLVYGASAILAWVLMFGLAAEPAQAQCTLAPATTWNLGGNGNWTTKTNWSPATVPDSTTTNVCVTDATSTVTLDTSADVASLQLASGNNLNFNPGEFLRVNGGQIINDGAITINGGQGLVLGNNLALSGGGTLTLVSNPTVGGVSFIVPNASDFTLANSSTIQGAGIIGDAAIMGVNNSGTINANVVKSATSIGTLTLSGTLPVTNTGTLEATFGGVLQIVSNVNNAGGNIVATGADLGANVASSVNIASATIQGGTFTSAATGAIQTVGSATLDGVTSGPIAITSGATYIASRAGFSDTTTVSGTFNNAGNIQLNGGNAQTGVLELSGGTTLNGPGTLTLSLNPTGVGATKVIGGFTLTNGSNSTIQGEGELGANSDLVVANAGTINANVAMSATHSGVLILDANTQGPGIPAVINTGTLEATGGGVLQIDNIVNNQGGTITAQGTNSVVQMNGATIQGGTLNAGSGIIQTVGSATLDGSTRGALTIIGKYLASTGSGSQTTNIEGTITAFGMITLNGGGGASGVLNLTGSVLLNGSGTGVQLNDATGASDAVIQTNQSNVTLINTQAIAGTGVIGNGSLALSNSGIIVADSSAGKGVLQLNGTGLITNSFDGTGGTLDAASGGTLRLLFVTVNNANGVIAASGGVFGGPFGTVQVQGSTIQGGSLESIGGVMTTVGTATLDGATQGALVITPNSTYTAARSGFDDSTVISGTITNQGSIAVNGGATHTGTLVVDGAVTLGGGGTIQMSVMPGGGNAVIKGNPGTANTLMTDNMVQGAGAIGNSSNLTIVNLPAGTIAANSPGQTLLLNGAGGVTNNGTFRVGDTSTLDISALLTNLTGSPGLDETLTGGNWFVGGTLQASSFGSGGGELNKNAATITLDGSGVITDATGNNALSKFANNSGAFTVENGNSFNTLAPGFTDSGALNVGAASSFTAGSGGTGTYTQSGAGSSTVVGGTFSAGILNLINGTFTIGAGGKINAGTVNLLGGTFLVSQGGNLDPLAVNITGGALQGAGSITGDVNNSGGNVEPASAPGVPAELAVNGNYTQGPDGMLTIDLGGIASGEFSVLNVSDLAALDGAVDFTVVDGFTPSAGDDFTFLLFGAASGDFAKMDFTNWTCPVGDTCTDVFGANSLTLEIASAGSPPPTPTPEPSDLLLLGTGILALGGYFKRKKAAARR